ncbi:MAG: hypothetical protein QM804_01745 [Propionicimonas sp.]
MKLSMTARLGMSLAASIALALSPVLVGEAQAAGGTTTAVAQKSAGAHHAVSANKAGKHKVGKHKRHKWHRHARHCRPVEPWAGMVKRCSGTFKRSNHENLLTVSGPWAPEFEPTLNPFGRAGWYFVYVGNTPVGWVEMPASGDIGGTITLSSTYGGHYVKGTQRIALYDNRGRLVAWDWITLEWDW